MPKHKKSNDVQVFDFIRNEFKEIADEVIYTSDKGSVILWNRYEVIKTENHAVVFRNSDDALFKFSKIKNAMAFCVFDRMSKHYEAQEIYNLDNKISSMITHQQIHNRGVKQKDEIGRTIQAAKLNEAKMRYLELSYNLDKYIKLANYWQIRGFKNGTIRTTN